MTVDLSLEKSITNDSFYIVINDIFYIKIQKQTFNELSNFLSIKTKD